MLRTDRRGQLNARPSGVRYEPWHALGLIPIYNLLPSWTVETVSVKEFQSRVQSLVRFRAIAGCEDWQLTFSPRTALERHPLR